MDVLRHTGGSSAANNTFDVDANFTTPFVHGGASSVYTSDHERQDIHSGSQLHASIAETTFDESDSNNKMLVLTTHDPLKATVNTIAHYFSTGVGFLYFIVLAGAAAWMLVVTITFEETEFLDQIQVRFITRTFASLGFLVPLFIHGWATDAEMSFNQTTRSFARAMQVPLEMALNYKVVAFATPSAITLRENRWILFDKLFQLTKLLHYLNYAIFVNGHIEKVFMESDANVSVLRASFVTELKDTLGAGPIPFSREITTIMQSLILRALNESWIESKEYDLLVNYVDASRQQASSMAAGSLPSKNKILENHKYLVMAIYLGLVLGVEIYNEVERYAIIFYALQIPLLLGPILIPKWLGTVSQNSRRFKDAEYIALRNDVLRQIKTLEARCKKELVGTS